MRIQILFATAAVAAVSLSAALAGDMADNCRARLEADGRDTSGCQCLEDRVMADPALQEEFTRLAEIADPAERYAQASSSAKAAMDACTRK
jgi:hypothetical protein